MNPEFETAGKPIALPPDFAARVLQEAGRRRVSRRIRSRRAAMLATCASMAMVVVLAGRLPARLARHRQAPTAVALLSTDWNESDTIGDDDDFDPGSYFLAEGESSPDPGDEPDSALLGEE